jgi:hypothetical protein
MRIRNLIFSFVVVMIFFPARAGAQNLSGILVDMLSRDITLSPASVPGSGVHAAHFSSITTQEAPYIFNQEIVTQLATFPTGSSSGGFAFQFNPATGAMSRTTDSFGPSFAERAVTVGRGALAFGMNFQTSKFDRFNNIDTENGDLTFYLRHAPIADFFYEGDLVEASLALELSTVTTSFFLNYGVTDRFDIAATIPIIAVSMDATVNATILRLATVNAPGPAIHSFEGGGTQKTSTRSGSSAGVGDILLRAKYRFMDLTAGGLAAGVDIRTPTGDAENLLGLGATQAAFTFIGSSRHGKWAPHFNIGYTVSGDSDVLGSIPDEFGYRGGIERVINARLTVSGELLGRALLDMNQLELGSTTLTYRDFFGTVSSTTFDEFQQKTGTLNSISLAFGGKFNVRGNVLVTANVLFPVNWDGIRARVTPVIGVEYTLNPR